MTFKTLTNTPPRRIVNGIALLTLFALLNAMSIPMICGLGWCTPGAKADCCGHSEAETERGCHSDDNSCSKDSCPFAHTGACTGQVYLHESDFVPEVVITVDLTTIESPSSCPAGFTFDLIRPPSSFC